MAPDDYASSLAVIGLACRVPGAASLEAFWSNLCAGRDSITDLSLEELRGAGIPEARLSDPHYVRSRGIVEGVECFDAAFFGYTPREAALTDPQQRLFLEGAWHALEDAGCIDQHPGRRIGVFAGCGLNAYLLNNLTRDRALIDSIDYHQLLLAVERDYLATRVSYKLDLTGPSITVATACSTSLVAVHQAAQSILNGECDVALAGGVSVPVPLREGFLIEEDGALSPQGRCHSFDAAGNGIGAGSGLAIVVLARMGEALAAGSRIYAVLRGSAINNDGAFKTGFTAPSARGQALVISEALAAAGVDPATIGYVEAHGTGTPLGDPIEVAALTQAYRAAGARASQYCALGSVKSNIGHLDAAAGAIGFIKAALMLHHRRLVPSLYFSQPNPEIDFASSPFFVNTQACAWEADGPRRAAVSAFGLGGTNAHAILEEAPDEARLPAVSRPYELLVVSARSDCALERVVTQLDERLANEPALEPAEVAFTLARRRHFERRRAFLWERATNTRHELGAANAEVRAPELAALGRAWLAGESVEPRAIASHGKITSLPGYPFEPEAHWIAPPRSDLSVARNGVAPLAQPVAAAAPPVADTFARVKEIVARQAGIAAGRIEATSDMFDLGLDSLALIQVNRALKDELGVSIALSELLSDLSVVGTLAQQVAEMLVLQGPAETAQPEPELAVQSLQAPAPPNVAGPAVALQGSAREQIIAQQLEIMRMQLEALGATPCSTAMPLLPAAASPSSVPKKKPLGFASRAEPAGAGPQDPRAQEHLRALVARYTARTRRSKEYAARHREALADSRASVGFRPAVKEMLYPIVGARGKGSRIWDLDGNEYVDLTCGFGVVLFGHHPQFVDAALAEQTNDMLLLGPRSPHAGEAAELIAELTGLPRVAFTNSGTEAVMAAIRLARARTGRSRIATFDGSYHGHADQTLAQSFRQGGAFVTEGIAPGIPPEAVAATTVLAYGTESLEYIRAHASELAAVLVEPIQNNRIDFAPPVEFLRELRALTERTGIALVFDEMISGFRLHPAGAQGYFGIEADIATYGKVIGGGMPIGVVAGRAEFMDGIDGGAWRYGDDSYPGAARTFFGGTFCQHPAAMIAAVATLREIKRRGPQMQRDLNARTDALAARLNGYFAREALPLHLAHFGSAFRISVPSPYDLLWYHLIERGVYVWEWRGCFLGTAHTDGDVDHVVQAIEGSIEALRELDAEPPVAVSIPALSEETFALTKAQRQLVALAEAHPNGARAYNMGFSLLVHGALDLTRFEAAVDKVVARHEAFRTLLDAGGETQRVLPELHVPVQLVDLSGSEGEAQEQSLKAWFAAKNALPVALERGPLLTLYAVRLAAERHLLVLTAHHAISDGWSLANVVGELFALYDGRTLEPAPQFRDYVAWQHRFTTSEDHARQEGYWLGQLAEPIPVLALPFDRPRPLERDYRAARVSLVLSRDETRAIKSLCTQRRCTLFIGLYAAYTALLHRYTGQRELLAGVPVAGRGMPESDRLVGYCTHILPVRAAVDPDSTFDEHLIATKRLLATAYENADYPFAALLERLQLGRDKSRVPLVSATFNLDRPTVFPAPGGLRLDLHAHPVDFSDLELMFNVIDLGDELAIDCDYSTELFDAPTVQRLLESYRALLQGLIADPAQRVARLPVLGANERTALAALDRCETIDARRCVHASFERLAARQPYAVAAVCGEDELTYGELNARANAIAHALIEAGVQRESLVGVCLEPSLDLIATLLGVLKAGAAYLPLDPAYPAERIGLLLEDARPAAVVSLERFRALLGTQPQRADLTLDTDRALFDAAPRHDPGLAVTLEQLAYVIYTSGSTGRPKGVRVGHDNLARLFTATESEFGFGPGDTWTLFHSFAFDFSVWEIFGALVHGGRLVVVPYWIARDPGAFYRLLCERGVTVLNQTPSAFRQLDAVEEAAGVDPGLRLRLVIFGGEALEPASLTRWFDRHGETAPQLVNMYGITETTVHVTYRPLDAAFARTSGSRIGRPLRDLRAYVLDRWMQPVPRGVVGELFVGGAGVAQGYLNQEALTRERFVPNPFVSGERLYRSGDLARWTNEGELDYLGRADQQVKVRGFRIEPGEIEAALRAHDKVRDAVVLARTGASGAAQLVGYVVGQAEPAALREFVARRLPEHMVPAAIVRLEAFPLTRNGKLDRTALPDPFAEADAPVAFVAPRTAAEERLAAIWAEVLGRERIGVDENFFELGGDSIVGMQIAARANAAGLRLNLRDVHRHPTIAALAQLVSEAPAANVVLAEGAETARLLPIQRWFIEQRQTDPAHHHVALVLNVQPASNAERIARALEAVIVLHPALRTGFDEQGTPFVRDSVARAEVPIYDLRAIPPEGYAQEIARVREELGSATRLDAPPLLRAALFDCGPNESARLLVSAHHLVIDGVSARILLDDLQLAYAQLERGEAPSLPPATASPFAWAAALERAGIGSPVAEEDDSAPLPRDFAPSAEERTFAREAHAQVRLSAAESTAFLALGAQQRPDDVILAALAVALGRWLGDREIAIDLEGHGREPFGAEAPDLTRSIGWFTTIAPVHLALRRDAVPAGMLAAVEEAHARLRSAPAVATQAEILFNYLGHLRVASNGGFIAGLAAENGGRASSPRNRRSHALEINAYTANGELCIDVAYGAVTHAETTIARLCDDLAAALRTLIGAPPANGSPLRTAQTSYGQERLWFLDRLEGESTAYHAQGAIRLEGRIDVPALRRALDEIVRRHEILRTTFHWNGERLLQHVEAPRPVPFEELDLRARPAEVTTIAAAQNVRRFDPERGPLLRVALLRLAEDEAIFILTVHHLVIDGWSRGLFFKELAELYAAYARGEPSPLPPLSLQYADYAEQQRRNAKGEAWTASTAYWRTRLAGAPELSTIPPDAPRTGAAWQGALCSLDLSPQLSAAIARLGRARSATTYMVLLAALELLVGRLNGTSDVVIGAPSAQRERPELEPLIGFFVNALALRVGLEGDPAFSVLLERVRDAVLDAQAHQEIPFEKVVEAVAPARDSTRTPIFQIFFNMHNVPPAKLELAGLRVSDYELPQLVNRFDVTLYVLPLGEHLRFELVYDASLYERRTIERVLDQFCLLLEQVVAQPEARIDGYSLLREAGREALPDPARSLIASDRGLIHDGFLRAAARVPERSAIVDPAGSWSYGELEAFSGRIAHWLLRSGCEREVVAVAGAPSAVLAGALIGTLRAGGAFLIVDPLTPPERVRAMFEAARPRFLIEAGEPMPFPFAGPRLEIAGRTAHALAEVPRNGVQSDDSVSIAPGALAYVAFTSGSTGTPLGIRGSHGPVSHFLAWQAATFGLEERDRFSFLSGVAHDPALRDLFAPLSLGATLHVPPPESRERAGALAQWLAQERISVAHLTPPLAHLALEGADGVTFPALRRVFFGGDVLTYETVRAFEERTSGCEIVNFYGTTETPQAMSFHAVAPEERARRRPEERVPIGRGIEGVQLLVRAAERLCGPGEPGEICVRTPYLSDGYLDPARNGERFTILHGVPLYRTGDLGAYHADGSVRILGRADAQVKIRGFRVEPRELEVALEGLPAVRRAFATADERGGATELIAFVVAQDGFDAAAAREALRERLPSYLVPARIVLVGQLPLTPNGKVDRAALLATAEAQPKASTFSEPRGTVERTLAAIWSEVLGRREPIGRDEDFFALGGHSLNAVRVLSRIARDLKVEVPLRTLFRHPCLRDLAAAVAAAAPATRRPIEALAPAMLYPASHAQRRLWALVRMGGSATYNMPSALVLEGALDRGAFERALAQVVRRHEALRTTFVTVGGELMQRIHAPGAVPLVEIELRAETAPLERARALAESDARREFELERDLPIRVALLALADERAVLLVNVHHIVADAWSIGVLIREFIACYDAERRSAPVALPELRVHYKEYAAWQQHELAGEAGERGRAFWHSTLAAPLPLLELPADAVRPPVRSGAGARVPVYFDAQLTAELERLAQERGATLFMVLLAAVKVLLFRLSGERDLIAGTPVAGRSELDLEEQIGLYVNMLALRDRLEPQEPFETFLARVAETARAAFAHQEYPFDRLVAELTLPRDVTRTPLFDVVVVLQNAQLPEFRLDGLRIAAFDVPVETSKFDYTFAFEQRASALGGYLEYNADLVRPERAQRIVAQLGALVRSIVAAPAQPLYAVDILPASERALVVERFNATEAAYPVERTLVDLCEEQSAARGEARAVLFEERQLSYEELNARANGLARALRDEYGLRTGERVGVLMERSELLPLVLLAVLKAGATYVPVDPTYPAERIAFMLEDAGCRLLLADRERAALVRGSFAGTICEVEDLAQRRAENLGLPISPDAVAYVIYTSGSTGRPKGCLVTHRNVVRLLKNAKFPFAFDAGDVWAMLHSPAFDFSVWEMYGALTNGAQLVVVPREIARDPHALRALVRRRKVSVLNQTPAAFYGLVEAERHAAEHDLAYHLRYVIFGGDRLAPPQLRDWIAHYPLDRVRLVNMYGITETTVHVTFGALRDEDIFDSGGTSPIGVPLPETCVYVCDPFMNPQPVGVPGELYVGGTGVSSGYLNRPDLTAQRFVPSPFRPGERLYRSGDLGLWRADGTLVYLGRNDEQVQLRGFRVELGEIRAALESHPAVREAFVATWQPPDDEEEREKRLVAWVVPASERHAIVPAELRAHLRARLPEFMVPSHLIEVARIPLGSNGKIDRARLPVPEAARISGPLRDATTAARIAEIWRAVLRTEAVGLDDNFFDLGGHSLLLIEVHRRLVEWRGEEIALVELFRYPTVRALTEYLERNVGSGRALAVAAPAAATQDGEIAIVGLAARFPGAADVEAFWRNLCEGVESNVRLSDEELRAAGVPEHLIGDARYVRNKPLLDGIDQFDAEFFGISRREAEIMDPQHRLFLECAWEALENAGYDPGAFGGRIGVFAAASLNSYVLTNLLGNRELLEAQGVYGLLIGNDRDFLATRVSYKLNLRGPALAVGTACSGSMVAVHLAVQSLRAGECEMALAGGVSVKVPQHEGYLYDEGGILSPDGRCRAFDAQANGTVGGSGAGIVVLKRLREALRDGDHVYAVIRGIAVGNDGSEKVGYTAPSVAGQADVIARAQASAGVDPESITYVEAHGTGTSLGDPIEVSALTQAFRAGTERSGFCALGSVKTNIGHLDAAAGVAGLIKTALALDRGALPPTLNCDRPNPALGFAASPFFVNTELRAWERDGAPRRAGVSSFGLGGTNVHAVLEEAPESPARAREETPRLLQLSAPSPAALDSLAERLAGRLEEHPECSLSDVAYTLAGGRRAFAHRRVLVASEVLEAARLLRSGDSRVVQTAHASSEAPVTFLFPGGGSQHAAMGRDLAAREPVFGAALERCGFDSTTLDEAAMRRPALGLPALFAVEYAMAELLRSCGVVPAQMIGHSVGEYVAATLAGVFTLDDALSLVALRGRLFERLERGAMLSVALSEAEIEPFLEPAISIAAVNLPGGCVASGPAGAIERLAERLDARGIDSRRLHIDVAAHSTLVEPILDEFSAFLGGLRMGEPAIPFLSNLTGTWIRAAEATDPEYWTAHMRRTVRFADGMGELLRDPQAILLEVGPGNTLASLAQRHPARRQQMVLATMRRPDDASRPDDAVFLMTLGRLWSAGVALNVEALHPAPRRRLPLPGVHFERRRYWIDPAAGGAAPRSLERREDPSSWLYVPTQRRAAPPARTISAASWLVVLDEGGLGERVATRLRECGHSVATMLPDASPDAFPEHVVFAAALDGARRLEALLALARTWGERVPEQRVDLCVLTRGAQEVGGEEPLDPSAAAFLGPVLVIAQEQDRIEARTIDVTEADDARLAVDLTAELLAAEPARIVAFRRGYRWLRGFEPIVLDPAATRLRQKGVYLITGGTGGVGVVIARFLAQEYGARLVLFARGAASFDPATRAQIESLGGEVLTVAGDAGDAGSLRDAVSQAKARFGALDGVIHAAGVTTGESIFQPFEQLGAHALAEQAHPKLHAAQALAAALEGERLDFVLLISSNAALLGGLGLTAYAGASAALDLFAVAQRRATVVPWISSGWDGWPTARRMALSAADRTSLDRLALSESEAAQALRLVLAAPAGHVAVSAADLPARLARWTGFAQPLDDERRASTNGAASPAASEDDAPAGGALSTVIARLWCEMLGLSRVGPYDNFFELRGDSLLGSRMITRLGVQLGFRVPLRALFEAPTVAGLAERVAQLQGEAHPAPEASAPIPRLPECDSYPLSRAQRRLWLLAQVEGGSRAYHIALALQLDGALDQEALGRAFAAIAERHESLRTSIVQTAEGPVQRVHAAAAWSLELTDLSTGADPEAATERLCETLVDTPFDLERGGLVRVRLVRLGAQRHLLVLVLHHIVADGWSLSVLARELGAHYNAFRRGATPALPPLRVHYRDYAAWESGGGKDDRAFWHERLAGPLPIVNLPADYPRPAVRTFRGALETIAFTADERQALERLAQAHGASLFMVLCALVKVLIFRYTGARDVIVGTPVAGRRHPDLDDQIGFYLNTVVLRDELDPKLPFAQFLTQVRDGAVEAYAHDAYPFDELVEAIGGARDTSRSPLFDVQISMQNAGSLAIAFDELTIAARSLETGESKCDLSFDFDGASDGLVAGIRYDSALFAPATIRHLARYLRTLARSAAADPQTPCARLELFEEEERAALAAALEGPALDLPEQTLLDRFAGHVARAPERVAARCGTEQLTYRELDAASNRIANYLLAAGLAPGATVGVRFERSLEMLCALLGVLKAGCAYIPIDPLYPAERMALMLEHGGAALVLDAEQTGWRTCSAEPAPVRVAPETLAYVLFTSGSTGVPKGVEIGHRALLNFLLSMERAPGLGAEDVLLAVTTISFDIAGLELYLPLICGAEVVIAEAELARDGAALALRLDAGDITVMQATPATWSMLVAAAWKGGHRLTILCGGEALSGTLAHDLLTRGSALWNLYGPTETTIWSTAHRVLLADCASAHVTLGRPIHNTRVALLDGELQPVPAGVAGDLYIGGAGLARGYRGLPELSAERFAGEPRLYKTGDVARLTAGGTISFLGRSDHQVKVRGHRVELGEVEAAFLRAGAVAEAVVTAVADEQGAQALCAYVVPRNGDLDVGALRTHLATILPAYMIPSAYVTLDALPLGPSGKVDRAALPAPAQVERPEAVAPRTELEAALAAIWGRVLELESLGVEDDFFELGGHSLKATQIVFAIQHELGRPATLTDVFRHPTIAALARAIEARPRELALTAESDG